MNGIHNNYKWLPSWSLPVRSNNTSCNCLCWCTSICVRVCVYMTMSRKPHVAQAQQQALLMAYNRVRNWFLFLFCFTLFFLSPLFGCSLALSSSLGHNNRGNISWFWCLCIFFAAFLVILPKYCCICIVEPLQHFAIVTATAIGSTVDHGHCHQWQPPPMTPLLLPLLLLLHVQFAYCCSNYKLKKSGQQ